VTEPAGTPREIRFGRAICGDLAQAERREWWLSNGTGAYAAGTVAGTLTRAYHGLLVAPLRPPLGRVLVVAKADATLCIEEAGQAPREIALFSNRWVDTVNPAGFRQLESFRLDGRMPVWTFRIDGRALELRIWMEPGAATTYIAYRLGGPRPVSAKLRIALLVNARDHHGFTDAGTLVFRTRVLAGGLCVDRPGEFTLHIGGAAEFRPDATWYRNFDLSAERERGLPDRDNHFCAGQAELALSPGVWSGLVFSLRDDADTDIASALQRFDAQDALQLERATGMHDGAPSWVRQLVLAADSFVITRPLPGRPDGESVIAGYPWFGDWGRDTMIALPGLTLATGRFESARRILTTFAQFLDQGQLPNVFPDAGATPEYNTVDAALWFIEAWRAYIAVSGDLVSLRQCWPALESIITYYQRGTRFGIRVDPNDGLLRAGETGVQLTWMDAKIGDWVVTPRIGKPVEVNALWFNALQTMAELAEHIGHPADALRARASATRAGFQRFVNPASGGLHDVLDVPEGGNDSRIRPNQVLAVSLTHSPLSPSVQAAVVNQCTHRLLTSYGLRTLDPGDPAYAPRYEGDRRLRDSSYHQGTVWPWLMGHFALAEFRVTGDVDAALGRLAPLQDHLKDAGLGTVSEIFDAEPPHLPRGAPSQAWSVACTLEAWWRLQGARSTLSGNHARDRA